MENGTIDSRTNLIDSKQDDWGVKKKKKKRGQKIGESYFKLHNTKVLNLGFREKR